MKSDQIGENARSEREVLRINLKDKDIRTSDLQIDLLLKFKELLIQSNRQVNLVSRKKEQAPTILDQILDSLLAQKLIKIIKPQIVLDLGSGGGFPGIPLAILNPDIQFHLLEASHKRIAYLKKSTQLLSLLNTQILHDRVENLPEKALSRKYDLITARAVADLPTLIEWCRPLLGRKGILVTYTGNREAGNLERLLHAWPMPLKPLFIRSIDIGIRPEKSHRLLLIGNFW